MKFKVNDKVEAKLEEKEKNMLIDLKELLKTKSFKDDEALFNEFYNVIKKNDANAKEFFKACYKALINKEKGPKLAPFIMEIGLDKVVSILESVE
jgi:lysyl-tRNA synthetase class 1